MAQKRMFSLKIVDTDAFLDMPQSAQNLYFHLGMRADDEGFIGNINRISRMLGASEDDKKILLAKKFIILFESGVVVIKHWKMNNYLQNDRLQETEYLDEKSLLYEKENKSYTLDKEQGKPLLDKMYTKCIHSIEENSIDKSSIEENSIEVMPKSANTPTRKIFKPPTLEEVQQYCIERNNNVDANRFIDFYSSKGWMIGKNKMKDWKAGVRTWERNDNKQQKEEYNPYSTHNKL